MTLHQPAALLPETTTPESRRLINHYGLNWVRDEKGNRYLSEFPAWEFSRGWTHSEIQWRDHPIPTATGFRQNREWNNGYRAVWINRTERAIFTYCEGDLVITVDSNDDTFEARIADAGVFYATH